MKHFARAVLCLVAAVLSLPAWGQVATLYVTNSEATFIYEVSSSGKLTLTHGYVAEGDLLLAGTKSYIFGGSPGGAYAHSNIDSFHVNSNGSLTLVAQRNVLQDTDTNAVAGLFLDRSGASLYVYVADFSPTYTDYIASYNINKKNGELTYLGKVQASATTTSVLTFSGDNKYAFTGTCPGDKSAVVGFNRLSNGLLVLGKEGEVPKAPAGMLFCPAGNAADPTDHLAFNLTPLQDSGKHKQVGTGQLATFTVSSSGNVSTKSTYENAPKAEVGDITGIAMSPSGKLLAVGGLSGYQVFHFNGSSPITKFTGSLGNGFFGDFAWDNDNHLYALNYNTEHVHVFSATPSEVKEVPGSPFTIPNGAYSIMVVPK